MRCVIRWVVRALVVLFLLAAAAPPDLATAVQVQAAQLTMVSGGAAAARTQDPPPAKCCFTNPGYAGTCEVDPAKDETCEQILDYLNNPMSQGKGYCGNTQIRAGWKSAACEPKK